MIDFDNTLLSQVKGFLDHEEGMALHDLATKACKKGPCLEIGSYCGKSAVYLGRACKSSGSILFSLDHHRGSEEQQPGEEYFDPDIYDAKTERIDTFGRFITTIEKAGLAKTVVPIVCTSETGSKLWATPLGLVFIDGGHAFDTVFTDYNSWAEHVIPGGYLIFHDIFKDPSKGGQAPYEVYKLAVGCGLFQELPMVKTLGILRRTENGEV